MPLACTTLKSPVTETPIVSGGAPPVTCATSLSTYWPLGVCSTSTLSLGYFCVNSSPVRLNGSIRKLSQCHRRRVRSRPPMAGPVAAPSSRRPVAGPHAAVLTTPTAASAARRRRVTCRLRSAPALRSIRTSSIVVLHCPSCPVTPGRGQTTARVSRPGRVGPRRGRWIDCPPGACCRRFSFLPRRSCNTAAPVQCRANDAGQWLPLRKNGRRRCRNGACQFIHGQRGVPSPTGRRLGAWPVPAAGGPASLSLWERARVKAPPREERAVLPSRRGPAARPWSSFSLSVSERGRRGYGGREPLSIARVPRLPRAGDGERG